MNKDAAVKPIQTPVYFKVYDPQRFAYAVFYDANNAKIEPESIIGLFNDHAETESKYARLIERLAEAEAAMREVAYCDDVMSCPLCLNAAKAYLDKYVDEAVEKL